MKLQNIIAIAGMLIFINVGTLYGADYTSLRSGSWSDASTWSPSGIPVPGDNVQINSGHIITYSGDINWTSGTIKGNIGLVVTGKFTMSGGTFEPSTSFSLQVGGDFTYSIGNLAMNNGSSIQVGGNFNMDNTLNINNSASLLVVGSFLSLTGNLINGSANTVSIGMNVKVYGDVISNGGAISIGMNATSTSGKIQTNNGHAITIGGSLNVVGDISANNGNISVGGDAKSSSGKIEVNNGSEVNISGNLQVANSITINNGKLKVQKGSTARDVSVNNNSFFFNGADLNISTSIQMNNGVIDVNGSVTVSTITLNNTSVFAIDGNLVKSGNITISSGSSELVVAGDFISQGGNSNIYNNGGFYVFKILNETSSQASCQDGCFPHEVCSSCQIKSYAEWLSEGLPAKVYLNAGGAILYNSGTYVVPDGVSSITVECWGGGGAGGGPGSSSHSRAGGGGGAYVKGTIETSGGTSYDVSIGSGGATSSANGTATTFGGASTFYADYGRGGGANGNSPGAGGDEAKSVVTSLATGIVKLDGQNGSGRPHNTIGGDGGDAGNAPGTGGAGGASNNDGSPGSAPGGGGGGAGTSSDGGSGANGMVIVSWSNSEPAISLSPSSIDFGDICTNTTSSEQSFTINGSSLKNTNITVGATTGYAFSKTIGGPYSSSLTIIQGGGTFSQNIYVVLTPTSVANYGGNIVVAGGGASSVNLSVAGTGVNSPPTINAPTNANITSSTAELGGNITGVGCSNVTERGIYWSTTSGFADGDGTKVSVTSGPYIAGSFTVPVSGLMQNTVYYFKAFARNNGGTVYTTQQTFTTPCSAIGDPSVFGDNQWNVYAYNGDNLDLSGITYRGYYVETDLSFNTQTRWGAQDSPSYASGYQGCDVTENNHTFVHKRTNFACGNYQIDVPAHDDAARLYIDGQKVWEHLGCCDSHPNVWTGYLDNTSEVEFRVEEQGGDSYGALSFIPLATTLAADFSASTNSIIEGNNISFTDLSSGNPVSYSWSFSGATPSSSGSANPTVMYDSPGTYSVSLTVTNVCGDTDTETKTDYITVAAIQPCSGSYNIWSENFNSYSDGTTIGSVLNGSAKWTVNNPSNDSWFDVRNHLIEFRGNGGSSSSGLWQSQTIDISAYNNVSFSIVASTVNGAGGNGHETSDYTDVYYRLNSGSWTRVPNWNNMGDSDHTLVDDLSSPQTITVSSLTGNTLELRVDMLNSYLDEYNRFDDVVVMGVITPPTVNDPGDQVVDGGVPVDITFSGTGTTYMWTNDNPSIGLGASGSGTNISFTPENASCSPIVANIAVSASNGTCLGAAVPFTITVSPVDSEAPTISCISDITVYSSENPITIPQPATSDNCSVASVINDFNNSDDASGTYPIGTTTVEWTVIDGSGNSATCSFTVTVVDDLKLLATATDIQCIGNNDGTITATASGGVDPYEYKINEGSYQSSGNFSNLSEGDYTVWVKDSQGVEADSTITISQPTSADDQNLAGVDSWIGHVYKRLDTQNSPPSDVNAFTNYVGNISENETFFHDFGGSCFQVYSSGAPFVTVNPNYFAVRYRMNSSKSGIYLVNIGSDDGARLTIDGDLVYNQWQERGLVTDQRNLIQLTGSSSLLLEYYESGGGNQIVFDVLEKVSNEITADVMTSCGTTPATPISGNNAYTESPISSDTNFSISYQWQGTSDLSGSWGDIDGATSQNYTPTLSVAGTYYFRRILFVEKTNPGGIHVTAKDTSNVSTVVHYNIQLSSLIKNTSCNGFSDGEVDLTVSGGVSPYSFVWTSTDGVGYVASDEDQTGLIAGTYEVTVTDNNGCTSTGVYTVDIAEDVTKPSISCPAGNTVDCVKNMPVGATDYNSFVAAGGSASDNCTTQENLSITYQDVTDPGVNCKVTRTYTVTDDAGNSSTCDQIFTVTDNTSPQINCTSIEMETNSGCGAVYTVLAPDVSDFCSFGDIQPSYSYRLGNDSGNTEITGFGDVNNETFPLGATTITWSIEDECGNSSSCDQVVSVIFPITPIDYDDGSGTSSPGSGIQPLQTSTHTYQVDGGISESGYTYDWKLEDGSGNAVTSGYTINGDGTASISIIYNTDTDTLSIGNYILSIIKTKNTTCEESETLAISVLSNGGFDVSIEDLSDQQCQTPSSTTTTYIWQITFQDESGTNQPFQFDYAVQLEGSTMQSGTVGSFYLSDEWNLKPPASGDFPLVQTRKVANSSIIELVFTFANAPDLDRNIQVVIQNTKGAYSVSEPDVTNNTDAVKALKVPTISFE